jgi:hypothetical protein
VVERLEVYHRIVCKTGGRVFLRAPFLRPTIGEGVIKKSFTKGRIVLKGGEVTSVLLDWWMISCRSKTERLAATVTVVGGRLGSGFSPSKVMMWQTMVMVGSLTPCISHSVTRNGPEWDV